jgi:hypothetical protein
MVIWPQIAGFLLVGYLALSRSFAYIGVPPLFIGEIFLAAFLLLKPRIAFGTWTDSLLRPSPLNGVALTLLIFMAYGVWQVGRGVFNGSTLVYALKFFVFNYYTIYMFLGMWVGLHDPDYARRLIRFTAWVNGIYGLIFLLALRHLNLFLPGTDVPVFSPPTGQVVVILGLLCFERDLRPVWVILLVNVLVTLAWQVRAEWAGLAFGIFVWGLLSGRLGRVAALGLAGLAVLGIMDVAGIQLTGRTGSAVSLSENVARIVAPFDLELAKELSPNAKSDAGTAEWRQLWWEQIWRSAHSTPMLEAFGHGYGFNLFGLAPPEVRAGQETWDVRTPHSVFYYCLGYTGWVGVAVFAALQFAIFKVLWRAFQMTGEPAGVAWWVMGLMMASFEEGLETPYHAIPFYLLLGMTMAPALRSKAEWNPRPASAPDPSPAGRGDLAPPPSVDGTPEPYHQPTMG